jgi:large subunit ribosomal protein L6
MSRIGRQVVAIPSGVKVERKGDEVHVQGPKGSLAGSLPTGISVEVAEGEMRFVRADERKPTRAAHGLARSLFANMVQGVTEGFARELEIQGVGYRADVAGKTLKLALGFSHKLALGFSHPVEMPVPEGLSVSVQESNKVRIEGIDKEAVGQFAANVRSLRPPEPYKGKGIRYADEHVRRKVGKAGAA